MKVPHVGRSLLAVSVALVACVAATPVMASGSEPSGERTHGNVAVEPAYDYATGKLVYLSTPIQLPTPTHTNQRAVAPLYLVLYPAGSQVLATHNLNCMGVPGNCPDHDGAVAGAATAIMPNVYGNNPAAVPGHDHLVGVANTGGDFNVAWEVILVLFTNSAAANTHVTTLSQLNWEISSHNAIAVDAGFNFHCSVTSAASYWNGTPA